MNWVYSKVDGTGTSMLSQRIFPNKQKAIAHMTSQINNLTRIYERLAFKVEKKVLKEGVIRLQTALGTLATYHIHPIPHDEE